MHGHTAITPLHASAPVPPVHGAAESEAAAPSATPGHITSLRILTDTLTGAEAAERMRALLGAAAQQPDTADWLLDWDIGPSRPITHELHDDIVNGTYRRGDLAGIDAGKGGLELDDLNHVLTALADLLSGYPVDELAAGWSEAAARVARHARAEGIDDGHTWDVFVLAEPDRPA